MQASASRLPTLRPDQPIWAASPPVSCYMACICHRHLLLLGPKADTQFTSWCWYCHRNIWICCLLTDLCSVNQRAERCLNVRISFMPPTSVGWGNYKMMGGVYLSVRLSVCLSVTIIKYSWYIDCDFGDLWLFANSVGLLLCRFCW